MKSSLLNVLTICAAVCCAATVLSAQPLSVKKVGNGLTAVTDYRDGNTYIVKDVDAFIKKKYLMAGRVDGFGKRLSQKEFVQGTSLTQPVTTAVQNTAYTTRRLPGVRQVLRPLSRLFGRPRHQSQ